MSYWTYINGTITVRPMGRTQPSIKQGSFSFGNASA